MPSASGKILIIRGGAIGDFILTLPVLSALRQQFPGVPIELLGYPRVIPLAQAGGLADQTRSIEARALAGFFTRGGVLDEKLGEYFASFALIISFLYDPDRIFQENVARTSKAQFIVAPYRPDENGSLHATEAFLRPLTRLAIFDPDPTPRLELRPGMETARAAPGLDSSPPPTLEPSRFWLALHPGSGSPNKNWPESRWRELLQRLVNETSAHFLVIGGEAEGERLSELASLLPAGRRVVAQNLPLVQLGHLLRQAHAYIGHDSGITHLAAALALRGVVLWGRTRREVWRPRSEKMTVLTSPAGLEGLGVEEVLAQLRVLLHS